MKIFNKLIYLILILKFEEKREGAGEILRLVPLLLLPAASLLYTSHIEDDHPSL